MPSSGVNGCGQNTHTSLTKPKMDAFFDPPGLSSFSDCCVTPDECCAAPSTPCMDEECLKLMDELCQGCFDHQICEDPGCSVQCDECCEISCADRMCSTTHTQVIFNLSFSDVDDKFSVAGTFGYDESSIV